MVEDSLYVLITWTIHIACWKMSIDLFFSLSQYMEDLNSNYLWESDLNCYDVEAFTWYES